MRQGEWFTVLEGTYAGQVHLVGWYFTAIGSGPDMPDRWYSLASCPRCGTLVPNDDSKGVSFGYFVVLHENWHAITDYPKPRN